MSILEMIIVLVALSIGTVTWIKGEVAAHRTAILTAEGQNEQVINNAFAEFQTQNQAALLAGTGVTGFANPMSPTVTELGTNKYLKAAYRASTFWNAPYKLQITVVPAGCSVSAGTCHLTSVIYPTAPLTRGGLPDVEGAGEIVAAAGALFGFSNAQSPATITGVNGAWTYANPLAGTPAASILAINGYGTDDGSVYIRRDGGVTWTGNQNVNEVSLYNVDDVATQTVHASGLVQAGTLQSTGMVESGNIATPRATCAPNGAQAGNKDGSGQQLICRGGIWEPAGGFFELVAQYTPVVNGTVVPAPSCSSGGSGRILVASQNLTIDTTATLNFGPTTGTGPWTIRITDGNGNAVSGQATASVYCAY